LPCYPKAKAEITGHTMCYGKMPIGDIHWGKANHLNFVSRRLVAIGKGGEKRVLWRIWL
jgi:hypothetical protein